jgi:hypothetical protein
MARMPAFDRAISVVLTGAREQVQKALVNVVHAELDRVKRESQPSGYEQFVDGVEDKPIGEIDPFGTAVFHFHYHVEIIAFALETLRALSPVRSGKYKHSHQVFVDGAAVTDFRTIPDGASIVIASTSPYARRLEVPSKWRHGELKGQKRGWSVQPQVPQPDDSIYKHAADTLNRRYGNVMKSTYIWAEAGGQRVPAISLDDRRKL